MAFTNASGYQNLAQGNFTPQIFSQKVQKFFRRASVVEDITNTDYAGEIENFGDTVKIIKEPTITVKDYARGQTVDTQTLADDQITMTVDQGSYFAFKVDDIEERQSHVNFEALATSSGAYSLKKAYDYNVLKFIYDNASTSASDTGTDGSPIDGDAAVDTLADVVSSAKKVLDKNDVPEENRWLVAPPEFFQQLRKAGAKLSDQSVMADGGASQIRNGMVTDKPLFGFNMYSTNAIAVSSGSAASHTFGSSGSNEFAFLYGHMSGVATVNHIAKTELIRDPDSFADVVRGLHVYGRKILRSEAVRSGVITIGGTTGHPANGRTPYLVENTIDVSAINGDSGAAQNDVLRALDIPAETLIMEAGIEVITALSSSVTLDLGITGGDVDRYVDGDTNATGFSAPTATARTIVASADTLDVLVLSADSTAGKIRVFAVLCDVSGIDETDRNTDTQHDTAV